MDIPRLIADIHRSTGIRLDEADPVIAAAVINERLLDACLVDLRKAMRTAGDLWSAQSIQNEESAKLVASKIITDTAVWVDERFRAAAEAMAAKVVGDIRVELRQAERVGRRALVAAYVSGAFGLVSAGVAAGVLIGVI